MIEPEILKNDFYVEGSINSPRIIFSHLIYYFNFFFNDWYFSLYLLKIIQVSLLNAILFLAMFKFSEVILNDKKKLIEINKFIFFIFNWFIQFFTTRKLCFWPIWVGGHSIT